MQADIPRPLFQGSWLQKGPQVGPKNRSWGHKVTTWASKVCLGSDFFLTSVRTLVWHPELPEKYDFDEMSDMAETQQIAYRNNFSIGCWNISFSLLLDPFLTPLWHPKSALCVPKAPPEGPRAHMELQDRCQDKLCGTSCFESYGNQCKSIAPRITSWPKSI